MDAAIKNANAAESVNNTAARDAAYLEMINALRADRPEKVKLKLFKDSSRYKSDVLASVNGRRFLIQRGVEVEVPYAIAKVIEDGQAQDEKAAQLITRLAGEARYA